MHTTTATAFVQELEMEYTSTRKCLERISETVFDYKPHPTSMEFGYLAKLVAAIPLWITTMVEKGEIDFVTFPRPEINSTKELVDYYEENFKSAKAALEHTTDEELEETFYLKANGETVYSGTKKENIATTLNHWVHHRGQLTVYMRLKEIEVPSIYGPSADDNPFK